MDAIERVLDDFIEGLFRLMLEHHQSQVVETDLTLVQAQALRLLRAEALPASKLAVALGISAPAMTQLTDRLGRKNLIERRTVKTDRRTVIVALTSKGGAVVDGFRRRRSELFADLLSRLGDDDLKEVVVVLGKVAAVLHGRDPEKNAPVVRRQAPRKPPKESRTAIVLPTASKESVGVPVTSPTKRRMRIEWD